MWLFLLPPLSRTSSIQKGRVGDLLHVASTKVVLMRALRLCKSREEATYGRNIPLQKYELFKDMNSLKKPSLMV